MDVMYFVFLTFSDYLFNSSHFCISFSPMSFTCERETILSEVFCSSSKEQNGLVKFVSSEKRIGTYCVVCGVMRWFTADWMILNWPVVYRPTGDWSTFHRLPSPPVMHACDNPRDIRDESDMGNHILPCVAVLSMSCTSLFIVPSWDVGGTLTRCMDNNGWPIAHRVTHSPTLG